MGRERRKHTRLDLEFKAKLKFTNKTTWQGFTKDISFGGAFICCAKPDPALNSKECYLQLTLNPEHEGKIINFSCRQIRTTPTGAAVQFITTDIADYDFFEKVMIYNSPNPDKLADELDDNPGLIVEP